MAASVTGHKETVEVLLQHRAKLNGVNNVRLLDASIIVEMCVPKHQTLTPLINCSTAVVWPAIPLYTLFRLSFGV